MSPNWRAYQAELIERRSMDRWQIADRRRRTFAGLLALLIAVAAAMYNFICN